MADAPSIGDKLGAIVGDFDRLVAKAEEGCGNRRPDLWLAEVEAQAQAVAAAILTAVRGKGAKPAQIQIHQPEPRLVHPPLLISGDGRRGIW